MYTSILVLRKMKNYEMSLIEPKFSMIVKIFFLRQKIFSKNLAKKFLSSLFKVILGQKFRNRFGNGKLKQNGLDRDHPPASAIYNFVSVGVTSIFPLKSKHYIVSLLVCSSDFFAESIE